ncbi:PREDICTED: uncharacterized protein KIAA1958 homolog [Pygoscelis adeliae]|uniref:uncharacterized protein KIAA1958 homolog n=1 Tax=Pygoscelis adeliae TaxID=9238 RepID=UPI0004F4EB28|nr:PREDICTED: uncharacterized protein KIAA1958 homolog [Pygoscelis adeliae]
MEDCLHTSSENLSKLVSWAHSHGTICSLIPNLKHLLSEGAHGNLTAMWGCSAGHAYHWPLAATCRAGSQERVCFQDSRSFNSDSPSMLGVPSEAQASPLERYPGRPGKAKLDCTRTRDSCDFSYCSEPSELGEPVEEYEDEATLFDMVCESSTRQLPQDLSADSAGFALPAEQDERAAELSREQNEKTIRSTQTALRNFPYSTKLSKFPVFNFGDDLKYLCINAVSPNTTKATLYALNVWRYWCMTKGLGDYMDITKIPAVKLNELLEDFYITVKKTDGSDFLATSLHAIRRGLDRILKNAGAGFSITSSTFSSSTRKLKEKLKVLSKAGMSGARSRNIVYFSLSDEEEMWRMGCLGDDSPVALLSTVVKYNSQHLNMRTLQEHVDLMFGDIELLKDSQNRPFFARTDSMKQESRVNANRACYGQIYHEHSKGHKLCPYCLLYKYMFVHRPPTQMEAKSPFYLTPRKEVSGMGNIWYKEQRMGLRSLRGVVPKLAKKVKLEHCENFTFVSFTQASRKFEVCPS